MLRVQKFPHQAEATSCFAGTTTYFIFFQYYKFLYPDKFLYKKIRRHYFTYFESENIKLYNICKNYIKLQTDMMII